mgnify:CR=1 FL=1
MEKRSLVSFCEKKQLMNSKYVDIQYFGSVEYYLNLINCSYIAFSSSLRYQKSVRINRMWLVGPNNPLLLSIPLEGGRNQTRMVREVRIDNSSNWARTHWRSIHDAYRKAPWFDEYAPGLEALFQKTEPYLFDFCQRTIVWACDCLKWRVDILSQSDPAASPVLDRAGSRNPVQQLPDGYPVYSQVFAERHGFIGNLSIIDLILCMGPAAGRYLMQLQQFFKDGQYGIGLLEENT